MRRSFSQTQKTNLLSSKRGKNKDWSDSDSYIEEPKKAFNKDKTNYKEITGIRYIKDIGLVATSFEGLIKIFDAFNF
jgi:hypothetical protein